MQEMGFTTTRRETHVNHSLLSTAGSVAANEKLGRRAFRTPWALIKIPTGITRSRGVSRAALLH